LKNSGARQFPASPCESQPRFFSRREARKLQQCPAPPRAAKQRAFFEKLEPQRVASVPRRATQSKDVIQKIRFIKNRFLLLGAQLFPAAQSKALFFRKILSALRGTAEPSKAKTLEKLRKLYDALPNAAVQSKALDFREITLCFF